MPHDAVLARYYVAMALCLFLPPSITSRYCIETIGLIEMVLAWRLSSTYPTLCYKPKEIRVPPKIREIPSGTLSQTLDWKKFATAFDRVSKTCRRLSLLTTLATVDASWLTHIHDELKAAITTAWMNVPIVIFTGCITAPHAVYEQLWHLKETLPNIKGKRLRLLHQLTCFWWMCVQPLTLTTRTSFVA